MFEAVVLVDVTSHSIKLLFPHKSWTLPNK